MSYSRTMLLFVKKRFVEQIRSAEKTYEVRLGARYRGIRPGDKLSINGHFSVQVIRVDVHDRAALLAALPISETDLADCYGAADGPFYVFHFMPPIEAPSRRSAA